MVLDWDGGTGMAPKGDPNHRREPPWKPILFDFLARFGRHARQLFLNTPF